MLKVSLLVGLESAAGYVAWATEARLVAAPGAVAEASAAHAPAGG